MDAPAAAPQLSLKEQRDAFRDGRIMGFHCDACSFEQVSPMVRCPECHSAQISTRAFANQGTVVSYTIQHVAAEAFLNEVPFAFAVIQLDDGPRMSGWIPFISRASELPTGQKVVFTASYKPGMMFEKA
jgi:uncharacterized protein